MKKMVIILLIVLLIGVIIAAVGFAVAYNAAAELDEKSASFDYNDGDNIIVDCTKNDVIVSVGDDIGSVKIKYFENKTIKTTASKIGKDISFIVDKKGNFFIWNAFCKKTAVTVTLPKNFCGDVTLKTTTGKIDFDASGITVRKLETVIATGETALNSVTASDAAVKSTTGKITVNSLTVENNLAVSATTGNAAVNGVTVGGDFSLDFTTGGVKVTNAKIGGKILANATTGKIDVEATAKKAEFTSTTGDVNFKLTECDDIFVKATTGDVSGKIYGLLADYTIFTSTTTGKSNVSAQLGKVEGKVFRAETTTGDIVIEFA